MTDSLHDRLLATRFNGWLTLFILFFVWGSGDSLRAQGSLETPSNEVPAEPGQPSGPSQPSTSSALGQEAGVQFGAGQADSAGPTTGLSAVAPDGEIAPGEDQAKRQLDAEAVLKMFREQASEEELKLGMEALAEFERRADAFKSATLEMRTHHTRFVNGYTDDKSRYKELRNKTRAAMNSCYRGALDLISFMPHPDAARFIATVLDFRVKHDIYDSETYEGAAKLLDGGVRLRYVVQAAARAGMMNGGFATSKRIYDNLSEEDLEDLDLRLISQFDTIEEQFETEQKLLKQDPDDLPKVKFATTRGEFTVELYLNEAPSTVSHFIRLCENGFYDGLDFFQVIESLLALTGDPLGDGSTRPDRFLADEHEREVVRMPLRGSLVMAKIPIPGTGNFVSNSAGTQFAILFLPFPKIIEQQTVFGRVIDGMDVVGELRRVDPSKKKGKQEIVLPPDRIISCEVLNRPDELPEPQYGKPEMSRGPASMNVPIGGVPSMNPPGTFVPGQ